MTDLTRTIEIESARFLDAVLQAAPDAAAPTCPGWTADDLLWHLTEVHAEWAGVLRANAQTEEEAEALGEAKPDRPADRAAVERLFREETDHLLTQLARRDDDEPVYFWLETASRVASIRRMQAHEATMHRVDAEVAAGLASAPIDPDLAADGIAHGVEVMWAYWGTLPGFAFTPRSGVVGLTASDLGRSWLLQPGRWTGRGQSGRAYDEPGVVFADGGSPVATLTGTVEELYRWLWGRGPEPAASGDEAALAALRLAHAQGMQ